ncbi:MAG: AsmA-like C-terminal region-containing protein [Vicingaceae bacterium]
MRILKKITVLFLVLILLFVASIITFSIFYGDEIKAFVVENINKNLRTEVEVAEVEFSVWESFPLASVVFSDVVIHAVDAKNDTLLAAKKIAVQLNLSDLLQKKYKITGVEISDGKCAMLIDNSGRANYIFWNQQDSNSSAGFNMQLEQVKINHMDFTYADYSKKIEISVSINETDLSGSFYESVFDLEINSALMCKKFIIGELSLFENRKLFVYSEGSVDQSKQEITFKNSNLGIDDMNLKVNGNYSFGEKISKIDLVLKSENTDLARAIALFPKSVRDQLSRYKIIGEAVFSGQIAGDISAISAPSYVFNFAIENGVFQDTQSDLQFSNSFLKGTIENGAENSLETTKLRLETFETTLNEGKIKGNISILNFKNPLYEFHGSVGFGLRDAVDLFGWKMVLNPKGRFQANLDVKGKLAEVGKYDLNDWKNSSIKGNIEIIGLGFQYKSRPQILTEIHGDLNFNNNSIEVNSLTGKIDESQLNFSGKFNNLIGFLLEKEQPLFVDATLSSPKVNLASFLESNEKVTDDSSGYELEISPYVTIYLTTKLESLVFKKFDLRDLKADVIIKNEGIDVRNARFFSQEGRVEGDLFIRELDDNRLQLTCEADLEEVDVHKLFNSFNNFGQQSLKAENISGIANASVRYRSKMSKKLEIDPKTIEAEIDLNINNGVLENYQPLEVLSKFIDLDELKHVEFKQLNNQVLIKNETVYFPKFDVNSTALDVNISGTHTFGNEIDYHFTLFLNQLLNRKVKKPKQSEFGYVEDDGLGKSKLYLKMTGTVENPNISYDSEQLKATIKERFTEEKQSVKQILNEEFGLFKKDSIRPPKEQPQKTSPFQVEIDSSYTNKREKSIKNQELQGSSKDKEEKTEKKSKFGKFMDKIASPNEEEYVEPK